MGDNENHREKVIATFIEELGLEGFKEILISEGPGVGLGVGAGMGEGAGRASTMFTRTITTALANKDPLRLVASIYQC